ncbi:MAG: peroxidase-related enzyme [Acidobacteriota bacterium]
MSRFAQITDTSASPQLGALYREIVNAGLGREVPINWFTAQSARPDILEKTWTLMKGLLLQGKLPPTLKQMIILRVSTHNNCRYCRVIHRRALEAMGVPAEVIDRVTTDVDMAQLPPVQRAIVEFAAKTAADPKSISNEDFEKMTGYGLNQAELIEVAMTAAFANFVNTWADASGILIDQDEGSA